MREMSADGRGSHYDHLEPASIRAIGDRAHWFVPKGVKAFIVANGVSASRVTDME